MTIYPNIEFSVTVDNDEYITRAATLLRKKHTDGLWYLLRIVRQIRSDTSSSINQCLNDFNTDIYLSQLSAHVIPERGWVLDEDQRSEEERLK